VATPARRDVRDDWRASLLARFGAVLGLAGAPLVAFTAATMPLSGLQAVACLGPVVAGALAVGARRLDLRARGLLIVVSLIGAGSALAGRGNAATGMLLTLVLATVVAAVVFGRRGGGIALAASTLCLLVFGILGGVEAGDWLSDRPRLQALIRVTATFLLLTALIVQLVSSAVRQVERSLAATQASLGDAIREREARGRAEEALVRNEERLRLALEAARMATWEWDLSTGTVSWSGQLDALADVLPASCRGRFEDVQATVHEDDDAILSRIVAELLFSDQTEYASAEYRLRGTDPVRWLEVKGRVDRDAAGRPLSMRGTAADVTARKQAEEALRDSEERWRRLSEASFEGIAFSHEGVIADANARLAAMLGYAPGELLGMPVMHCVALADRDRVGEALRSGLTGPYEHRALRKDGTTFPVEIRARSLSVAGKAVRVSAIRDLSERTRLEAELRRRETLAAMGSLVAAVAHEVRTPLFSLTATVDALEAGTGASVERRELHSLLRAQAWRLSDLMQELLDYGQPPRLTRTQDWLPGALRGALETCRPLAQQARVHVTLDLADDLPDVPSDARRLRQVFENLVANALQHSPPGATVRVSVTPFAGPAGGLVCRVEDEGPGVPPEDFDRLFQPFFSRRQGGTGMGLPVAHRFVEAHGGSLTAANRPEGGAVFTVLLPAQTPDRTPAPA
jgi:PAS domain S-box-containing protein